MRTAAARYPLMRTSDIPERTYSIAAVSKLTGVSCHALRAWERRFGFPSPMRSETGHRRYGEKQVQTLRQLAGLLQQGKSVGAMMACLVSGCLPDPVPSLEDLKSSGPLHDLTEQLLQADYTAANQAYRRLTCDLEPTEVVSQVVEPLLVEFGERWFRGRCDVTQERCATTFLMKKLAALHDQVQEANVSPTHIAVVGTVQGDRHEAGAIIFSLLLECAGWRAICLGSDLPVSNYQRAIDLWRPSAVGVSFVLSRNINKRFDELGSLRGAPVYVGGRSILNYQGLARRHGLIPLPGPATDSIQHFLQDQTRRLKQGPDSNAEVKQWPSPLPDAD